MTTIVLTLAHPDRLGANTTDTTILRSEIIERANMQTCLEKTHGNISKAAAMMNVDRRTFQRNLFWNWRTGEIFKNRGSSWAGRKTKRAQAKADLALATTP